VIYQINNKFYIRTAPMRYTEVKLSVRNDDVIVSVTNNRIVSTGNTNIKEINFQENKEKIKASLLEETKQTNETSNTSVRSSRHRKRA
jgi:hypothetical protein